MPPTEPSAPKPLRVLIADDHPLVRAGLRQLLQAMPDVAVVGESCNGLETLALAGSRHPDVVLLDIAMPGLNGLEAAARLASQFPGVKVVILSMHHNEEYVIRALRLGVAGYILKDSATAEVELALAALRRGEPYLSPVIARRIFDVYAGRVPGGDREADLLTPRQREILKLLAEGHSAKSIAFTLNISVKTVETHRAQLMQRLGIHDLAGLVKYAIRAGLIPPVA